MPIDQDVRERALRGLRNLTPDEIELFKSEVVRIVEESEVARTSEIDQKLFPPSGSHQNMRGYQFIAKCRDEGRIMPRPPGNSSPWILAGGGRDNSRNNSHRPRRRPAGHAVAPSPHKQKATDGTELLKEAVMDVLKEHANITIVDLSDKIGTKILFPKRGVGAHGLTWAIVVMLMAEKRIGMAGNAIYLLR